MQLRSIISQLQPRIAAAKTVTPEQIKSLPWDTVSARLHEHRVRHPRNNNSTNYVRKGPECMRRYSKLRGAAKGGAEKAGASKGPWTEEEDMKVLELVKKYGPKKWSVIAGELPGEFWETAPPFFCLRASSARLRTLVVFERDGSFRPASAPSSLAVKGFRANLRLTTILLRPPSPRRPDR